MTASHASLKPIETRRMERTAPLPLHEADCAWLVKEGAVDIFIAQVRDGGEGSRNHFVRIGTDIIIFPFPESEALFLAVGSTGTTLEKIPLAQIDGDVLALRAEQWIQRVADKIPVGVFPPAFDSLNGELLVASPGRGVRSESGFTWLRQISGNSRFVSLDSMPVKPGDLVPMPPTSWIEPTEECEVAAVTTQQLLEEGKLSAAVTDFQKFLVEWARTWLNQMAADERNRMSAKASAERGAVRGAVTHLSSLLDDTDLPASTQGAQSDPLVGAFMLIGETLKVPIKVPPGLSQPKRFRDPLAALAKSSRIRLRRVVLSGEWWKQDSGPILAYRAKDARPVAIIPTSSTSFALCDPIERTRLEINAEVAQTLNPVAFTFSRPFAETAITVGTLMRFGLHNTRKDAAMMLTLGFAGGALGMLFPLMTGIIFDSIIPSAARHELIYATGALVVAGCAGVVFRVIRSLALLRLEAKSDAAVQGAVWDRLLSLPLPFFRNFTAGDLADRANGINAIRQIASGAVMNAVLNGVFSLFSFALLFYYSIPLAALATGLVIVYVGLSVGVSLYGLRFQRPIYDMQGKISGQILQFITGITKLRVAGAEVHAYAVWARGFSRQKKLHLSIASIFTQFNAFGDIYPILTTLCLFVGVIWMGGHNVSTGKFLAFSAAFNTFLYAMLDLSGALISLLHAAPIYERAKPILTTLPEVNEAKADPGELRGKIELSHVSFRYKADGPLILRDISLQIQPGQFVAVVGPSGSGKSTLIRLLLGFDTPESGTIAFDGMDMSGLDIQSVRKQLGVVLQNGKLMPGDIYQNIVGSSQLSLEAAWEAAESAGLAEDIRAMPMGMHTVLSEGAGTLSGGQRQRLMIARAVVAKPRILIFDEATSALDNRTQEIVSRSLEKLQATRIVIAHRLSTIINADKIIVVKDGILRQSGTYDELVNQEGPFAELAKRQLA